MNQGELEEPSSIDEKSSEMKQPIHWQQLERLEIIASLSNLALEYEGQAKLIKLVQFHEGSLVMERIVHVPNTLIHHLPI